LSSDDESTKGTSGRLQTSTVFFRVNERWWQVPIRELPRVLWLFENMLNANFSFAVSPTADECVDRAGATDMLGAVSCYDYLTRYGMGHCSNPYIRENCCAAVKYVCNGGGPSRQLQHFGWVIKSAATLDVVQMQSCAVYPRSRPTSQPTRPHVPIVKFYDIYTYVVLYIEKNRTKKTIYNLCEIDLLLILLLFMPRYTYTHFILYCFWKKK